MCNRNNVYCKFNLCYVLILRAETRSKLLQIQQMIYLFGSGPYLMKPYFSSSLNLTLSVLLCNCKWKKWVFFYLRQKDGLPLSVLFVFFCYYYPHATYIIKTKNIKGPTSVQGVGFAQIRTCFDFSNTQSINILYRIISHLITQSSEIFHWRSCQTANCRDEFVYIITSQVSMHHVQVYEGDWTASV